MSKALVIVRRGQRLLTEQIAALDAKFPEGWERHEIPAAGDWGRSEMNAEILSIIAKAYMDTVVFATDCMYLLMQLARADGITGRVTCPIPSINIFLATESGWEIV
jgi:hypothetical protein